MFRRPLWTRSTIADCILVSNILCDFFQGQESTALTLGCNCEWTRSSQVPILLRSFGGTIKPDQGEERQLQGQRNMNMFLDKILNDDCILVWVKREGAREEGVWPDLGLKVQKERDHGNRPTLMHPIGLSFSIISILISSLKWKDRGGYLTRPWGP